jgi:hypothetical protein
MTTKAPKSTPPRVTIKVGTSTYRRIRKLGGPVRAKSTSEMVEFALAAWERSEQAVRDQIIAEAVAAEMAKIAARQPAKRGAK